MLSTFGLPRFGATAAFVLSLFGGSGCSFSISGSSSYSGGPCRSDAEAATKVRDTLTMWCGNRGYIIKDPKALLCVNGHYEVEDVLTWCR